MPNLVPVLYARNCISGLQRSWIVVCIGCLMLAQAAGAREPGNIIPILITNVATVRSLSPEISAKQLPVRLEGVITYFFDERACFLQDQTAGIFVGNGVAGPHLSPGDLVEMEGTTDSGEYAPIVQPSKIELLGHTNLPPARRVSYEQLVTGREASQPIGRSPIPVPVQRFVLASPPQGSPSPVPWTFVCVRNRPA